MKQIVKSISQSRVFEAERASSSPSSTAAETVSISNVEKTARGFSAWRVHYDGWCHSVQNQLQLHVVWKYIDCMRMDLNIVTSCNHQTCLNSISGSTKSKYNSSSSRCKVSLVHLSRHIGLSLSVKSLNVEFKTSKTRTDFWTAIFLLWSSP